MKTNIVYCLVSTYNDYYYEQLLISLCSLRKYNPIANVTVVCDRDTFNTLVNSRKKIFDYGITIQTVEIPKEWNNKERSRYIKTHLRSIISGDYLFIDTDTIICKPLDIVDTFTCTIGAVYDSHVLRRIPKKPIHETEKWICRNAQTANQNIVGLLHFNSGVLYVKDHPLAYSLYESWATLHKQFQKEGVYIDQLPLMIANKMLGEIITSLPPEMNCQAIWKEGTNILSDAHIIHYFPGQKKFILSSPWILDPIKDTGELPSTIHWIIDNPEQFFNRRSYIVIGKDDVDYFESETHTIFKNSPRLYQFLLKEIKFIQLLKRKICIFA